MGALQGLRVLELSRVLAGPWCGMMLADLGADVIKLEPPGGDDTRGLGPPFRDGLSAYFACCNRNKRSIALDLTRAEARPLLHALLSWADVVIENFRTGVPEMLGVGYADAAAINPRLVYCSISGYGREGPDAQRGGYDFVIQAEAGLMGITGPADGPPSKVGVAVADLATGQNAAIAILAALRERDRSGQGQHVAVALYDSQLAGLCNVASSVLFEGVDARRLGNAHPSIVPYQAFHAADGEIVVAVASEKLWQQLCDAIGRADLRDDARCRGNAARVMHRDWLCAELARVFATRSVHDWVQALGVAGVPAAPIHGVRAALEAPLTRARGLCVDVQGVPMVASPLRLARTPVRYERAPPGLGAHGDEIARELGFDPALLRRGGALHGDAP